jgi:D-alanyl-D-alanine carboxypeptidase
MAEIPITLAHVPTKSRRAARSKEGNRQTSWDPGATSDDDDQLDGRPTRRRASSNVALAQPISGANSRSRGTASGSLSGRQRAAHLEPVRVIAPYAAFAAPAYDGSTPRGAGALPPRVRPRRPRSRRVEWALVVVAALTLVLGACAVRPYLASQVNAPLMVNGSQDLSSLATVRLNGSQELTSVAAVEAAGPATVIGPPLSFSFAKFEADPALVAGAVSAGVPTLSGESVIVVDVNTNEVLYTKNPRKRHLPASTTKIMTALVAIERSPLDKVITVPLEATQVEPNHMGIRAGEKLTLEELLYGLMLDSGNDAAEAIAYGVGGGGAAGRAQFIAWMNEKVANFGLQDTKFANPSGLDDPQQYSSAYDLAVIGAHALNNPSLRKVFSTKNHVISPSKEPGRERGWFGPGNLNSLLSTYRGAVGIKPGYTEDAGYTLVAAAERAGRTLVAVTLNSRRHFGDCTLLLDFGFSRTPA